MGDRGRTCYLRTRQPTTSERAETSDKSKRRMEDLDMSTCILSYGNLIVLDAQ